MAHADPPRRVVSLVPSLTETLFALGVGERCVGATQFCVYPEAARGVPRVGGTKTAELDAVLAAQPDLVLVSKDENRRELADALTAAGIELFVSHPRSVPDIESMVRELGERLGRANAAARLTERMAAERISVESAVGGRDRPRVLTLIWKTPWMTVGRDTFMADAIRRAGAELVGTSDGDGWPELDRAAIDAARPEAVLLHDEPFRFGDADVAEWTERVGRAWCADGQLTTWAGPRIVDGLRWMAQRFHPKAFAP